MKLITQTLSNKHIFVPLASLGIFARFLICVAPGNRLNSQMGGIGDTDAYVELAQSLLSGNGFSYYGEPSAFRPPLYPLLLAGIQLLVGSKYLIVVRILQFLAGCVTAWICARVAKTLAGSDAARLCFLLVLFFPTLLYFTGEVLTETFAALLTSLFWCFLVRSADGRIGDLVGIGVFSGIAGLFRFNMIFLPLVAAWHVFNGKQRDGRWRRVMVVTLLPALIVLPWIIRNLIVFDGQVIYSTHTGMDLVEGLLRPQGRADVAQGLEIVKEAGWSMMTLTNGPKRLGLPSEPILNQMAMHAAIRLWSHAGTKGLVIIVQKLGYFWLSTDQIIDTNQLSPRVRMVRAFGVAVYWICLLVSIGGMKRLYKRDRALAKTFIFYFVVATALHIFFAMNTRLRVPLVDPLLCILFGFAMAGQKSLQAQQARDLDLAEAGTSKAPVSV